MVYENSHREQLNHRLSRMIGQLQGLQKRIGTGESDCLNDIAQVKAVRNALWKFAEAYVEVHLDECMAQKLSVAETRKKLQSVVQAAFAV
jgi:CsoR family transcriptional regulator, copper-sensing transcriptional repressor